MSDTFDAIVVGSGVTGGWAAKELCERGLKVLVLERGRDIVHGGPDYKDMLLPWELEHRNLVPESFELADRYAMLRRKGGTYDQTGLYRQSVLPFFVDDSQYPYSYPEDRPFMWTRGYQLGGRSLTWGRQTYRWGPKDFETNAKDGHGLDWPIRYPDLAPWYDHVEKFIGVSGAHDGLPDLPESIMQPAFEFSSAEKFVAENLSRAMPDRRVIMGRCAHVTEPTAEQSTLGRGRCLSRNLCARGCSFGAYFSSLSATLPAAKRTENLTIITDKIVHSLVHDPKTRRVTGVRAIDHNSKAGSEYQGRMIFVCAGSIASVHILLNSRSEANPTGLANSSDALGRYILDHVSPARARGVVPGFDDRFAYGRRPTGVYIPNFRHEQRDGSDFVRGYGYQGGASQRPDTGTGWDKPGIGAEAKAKARKPAPWVFSLDMFGEMLPSPNNRATLHPAKADPWGIPQIHLDCAIGENERKMIRQGRKDAEDMLRAGGCINVTGFSLSEDEPMMVGGRTHEMGGACMGRDPRTSVLNGWAQAHDVDNLFVTDGACMASCGTVNPSLTYMAITARAADRAVQLLKQGAI